MIYQKKYERTLHEVIQAGGWLIFRAVEKAIERVELLHQIDLELAAGRAERHGWVSRPKPQEPIPAFSHAHVSTLRNFMVQDRFAQQQLAADQTAVPQPQGWLGATLGSGVFAGIAIANSNQRNFANQQTGLER